jgi:hypothetical protein
MKITHLISALCLAALAIGCNEKKEPESKLSDIKIVEVTEDDSPKFLSEDNNGFPKVKNLNEFKQTIFLATPENEIPANKNAIYCSALSLTWDQVSALLPTPYSINDQYADLQLLDNSKKHKNSLKKNEYEAVVEVQAERLKIGAKVKFNKALPFAAVFESYPDELTFKGTKVASFLASGGYNTYIHQFEILYYENDTNYIVKLQPKDTNHEIILYLPLDKPKTLAQAFKILEEKRNKGNKERKGNWRYEMLLGDHMTIPKISFNIENNYKSMIGNKVKDVNHNLEYEIFQMQQQTSFMLDEYGAKIEGQAGIEMAAAAEMRQDKPIPKKLIFDKPFLVVLKRTDSPNPYFAMWVDNSELMIKE